MPTKKLVRYLGACILPVFVGSRTLSRTGYGASGQAIRVVLCCRTRASHCSFLPGSNTGSRPGRCTRSTSWELNSLMKHGLGQKPRVFPYLTVLCPEACRVLRRTDLHEPTPSMRNPKLCPRARPGHLFCILAPCSVPRHDPNRKPRQLWPIVAGGTRPRLSAGPCPSVSGNNLGILPGNVRSTWGRQAFRRRTPPHGRGSVTTWDPGCLEHPQGPVRRPAGTTLGFLGH